MGVKRSKILIYLLAVFWTSLVYAGTDKILMSDFTRSVRMEVNVAANSMLPDTALRDFSYRAILTTSSEIGGVERGYWITLADGTMLYTLPDSVVEIVQATLISDNVTRDIRQINSQYFNEIGDKFGVGKALDNNSGDVPKFYSLWNDSIQFYPIPVTTDSVYLKCYVEHPVCTASTDTVRLLKDYREAAKSYTIYLIYNRFQNFEAAAIYLADFQRRKTELRQKHLPKMEIISAQ